MFESFGANLFAAAPGGKSLLHLAIDDPTASAGLEARTATVQWLLDRNLDPDTVDVNGKTPLMAAAYNAHIGIVHNLLDAGADISLTDRDGRSALCHAVYAGTEYGRNERFVRPKSKRADKVAPVMALLLQTGANPDAPEIVTAASRWRWPGAVKWLTPPRSLRDK
jgi:ankyrin repeat protein